MFQILCGPNQQDFKRTFFKIMPHICSLYGMRASQVSPPCQNPQTLPHILPFVDKSAAYSETLYITIYTVSIYCILNSSVSGFISRVLIACTHLSLSTEFWTLVTLAMCLLWSLSQLSCSNLFECLLIEESYTTRRINLRSSIRV